MASNKSHHRLSRSMENLEVILETLGMEGDDAHGVHPGGRDQRGHGVGSGRHRSNEETVQTRAVQPPQRGLATSNLLGPKRRPSPQDKYVKMINDDWDLYEEAGTGKPFFHNPTTDEVRWKPPRKKRSQMASPKFPRSDGAVFTFGNEIRTSAAEDSLDGFEPRSSHPSGEADDERSPIVTVEKRSSIVRNSLRKPESFVPPPGYTEYYDKTTGLIHYNDTVNNLVWYTSLDDLGRLYFYTEDGSSAWQLPQVQSPSIPKTEDTNNSSNDNSISRPLVASKSGYARRKCTGYTKQTAVNPTSASMAARSPKKWQSSFVILSESYLLLFKDETAWKRMGMDAASLPEICVDLTQCRLSWASDPKHAPRGGVHHQDHVVLRLRSQLTGIDLQLHFEDNLNTTTDADIKFITATDEWFECLRPYVKEVAPLSQPNTPRSPPPPLRTVHYDHDLHEQLPKSLPATPISSRKQQQQLHDQPQQQQPQLEISGPLHVVKASPEELAKMLAHGAAQFDEADSARTATSSPKVSRKLSRKHGLSKSFRRMADAVNLRPKDNRSTLSPPTGSSGGGRILRVLSRRSVNNFARLMDRRASKDELVQKGILKPEAVFGNNLSDLPYDEATGVPEFLIRCVRKIETMANVVGIYRINGDAAAVQKLRLEIDKDNYKVLESTKDVALLASTLKLFFRELPEPLIPKLIRDELYETACKEKNPDKQVKSLRAAVAKMEPTSRLVLKFLLNHLDRVASVTGNKMGAGNLATVFSPNLVHSITEARRPESIISEIELNNVLVELLISHVHNVF